MKTIITVMPNHTKNMHIEQLAYNKFKTNKEKISLFFQNYTHDC